MENYRTEAVPDPEVPQEEEEKRQPGILRIFFDIVETLVLSVLLFVGINSVTARIRVDGFSMEPTLHSGEFVIVNKLAYRLGEPAIGDVVVFRYPRDLEQEYIKRIIGLPGDHIQVSQGAVFVNNRRLEEPYISAPPAYQNEWTVPEDSIFVLGDNRNNSSDSHNWGFVNMDYVIGKAVVVYWPPEEWGLIDHFSQVHAAP